MNGLSVGDGFKFGCGFMLAAFVAWLAMAIIGGIAMAIFGGALGALFGNLDLLSQVPQLLGVL
jgi:hypothetical protein